EQNFGRVGLECVQRLDPIFRFGADDELRPQLGERFPELGAQHRLVLRDDRRRRFHRIRRTMAAARTARMDIGRRKYESLRRPPANRGLKENSLRAFTRVSLPCVLPPMLAPDIRLIGSRLQFYTLRRRCRQLACKKSSRFVRRYGGMRWLGEKPE